MNRLKKALLNPFLLGVQGFLAGAMLFTATHPDMLGKLEPAPAAAAAAESR